MNPQATAFWEKANNFYLKESWDSAANYYTRIIKSGSADAAVYYNLGNADYKLGHTGAAVLNYRRAILRKPDYSAAMENMELAQNRIPGRLQPPEDVFFVRWWSTFTSPRYSQIWALAALVFFTVALVFLYKKRLGKRSIATQIIAASFIIWAVCLTMAIVSGQKINGNNEAVVMRSKAVLKTEDGKNITAVPEGTVLMQKGAQAGNVHVILPDGRSGWLSQQDVALVD